jgi:hypothetical protein
MSVILMRASASGGPGLVVVRATWFVAGTVGTRLTRTTNSRQRPDKKLKKPRACLLLRVASSMRWAVFPPCSTPCSRRGLQLQYP